MLVIGAQQMHKAFTCTSCSPPSSKPTPAGPGGNSKIGKKAKTKSRLTMHQQQMKNTLNAI